MLFTLGHSNHPFDHFLGLLRAAGIALVADVRSVPHSRRLPHFRRPALEAGLAAAGVGYAWQGEALGGRPRNSALWRAGKPDHAAIAAQPEFRAALDSVLAAARVRRVALMCAERDPLDCHRFHLLSAHIVERGAGIVHLLADGGHETHAETEERLRRRDRQGRLFS